MMDEGRAARLINGSIIIDDELKVDALLYLFAEPNSYTGDDVAEIHLNTNQSVTESLLNNIFANHQVRMAGPGEFTARAYLNGKIDLAQAEAVNEIVTASNKFQLAAAEKLLSGRLAETIEKIRSAIMDCLSLIEAGLDFSGEDIEFITREQAAERLAHIRRELEKLLADSINCETVIDLPTVGIAGAPNVGKSSLLNKLLGRERSIVSHQKHTTRDVLSGEIALAHSKCVLYDCAGLTSEPENILDELAQQAAVESLQYASVIIFCVDVSKGGFSEDIAIRKQITPKVLIPVATKSDLLGQEELTKRVAKLSKLFGADILATSAKSGVGLEELLSTIDKKLIEQVCENKSSDLCSPPSVVCLTARHKQAVTDAIENISEALDEVKRGNDEVVTMLLRAAYQQISAIEQQQVDEEILNNIFSNFCIGK